MAEITQPRQLFLHELGDILYAERKIVDMLGQLLETTSDGELRDGFARHREQTRRHADKLEEAFGILGEEPRPEHCPAIEGIEAERGEHFGDLSEDLHDVFNAGSAARTEHYEISVYDGLIRKGEALEVNEVVALLWENLKDEKETLQELNATVERLATMSGPGSAMP